MHYCVSCMFLVFLAYVFGVFLVSLMFGVFLVSLMCVMVANDNSAKVVTRSKVHTGSNIIMEGENNKNE